MRRYLASFSRVTVRVVFLAAMMILGLLLLYLPAFLNLDMFRPRLTDVLEKTFHCRVIVGNVQGELFPSPGFAVGHVVFIDPLHKTRILASVTGVHLQISKSALLRGRMRILAVRFWKPRLLLHWEADASGKTGWTSLALPKNGPSGDSDDVSQWDIRNGSLELWDHTRVPTSKWVMDHLNGSYLARPQTGAMAGRTPLLGPQGMIDIHYQASAPFPVEARLRGVSLEALESLFHIRRPALRGTAEADVRVMLEPALKIHASISRNTGTGFVQALAQPVARGLWSWSAIGKDFSVDGTALDIPAWSIQGDGQTLSAKVHATKAGGGCADVTWTTPAAASASALQVAVSSVSLRDVLSVFDLQSKSGPPAAGAAFNPYGYESWLIERGTLQAVVRAGRSFDIEKGIMDVEGMHLDMSGSFELAKKLPQAHIQGTVSDISLVPVVESFFPPPSPITGMGQLRFDLAFPLSPDWIRGLSGPCEVQVGRGVLRMFKTAFRIFSVLNLTNYLRLRLPQVSAQGIEFESMAGHLAFSNGVLSTSDLFIKSPDINIGVQGDLDIPAKRVKSTVRLEMFRFLETILKDVPITHWIFKKPNKIFLPLVVGVEGPWNNVDVL